MRKFMVRLLREDEGQDLVEYVLLVSLIALAVALAFPPVTQAITGVFNRVEQPGDIGGAEHRDGRSCCVRARSPGVACSSRSRRRRPGSGGVRAADRLLRECSARCLDGHQRRDCGAIRRYASGVQGLWATPDPGGGPP